MPMQSKRHQKQDNRRNNEERRRLNDSIDSQNSAGRISNQSFQSSGSLIGKGSKYATSKLTEAEVEKELRYRRKESGGSLAKPKDTAFAKNNNITSPAARDSDVQSVKSFSDLVID